MAPTIGGVSKNGMKRADANKPIIYDSMRGEKYVQQRFLGKVRALGTRARNDGRCHIRGPTRSVPARLRPPSRSPAPRRRAKASEAPGTIRPSGPLPGARASEFLWPWSGP